MITPDLHARLCRARERLRETSEHRLDLTGIAREAGLSPYYFIRLFAAVFGETPHQWRRRHQLEAARRMLANGSSVTDVCMETGFSSLGSFSSVFKRQFGEPPSAFRRRAVRLGVDRPAKLEPGCISLMLHAWRHPEQFPRSAPNREAGMMRSSTAISENP
jgi:AraC-like DNA-binding protein